MASVAARLDLPFDAVDEIRTAVNEAATLLLGTSQPSTELVTEIEIGDDGFVATLSIDAEVDAWPLAKLEGSWSWRVVQGFCDQAAFLRQGGRPGVTLRRRRPVMSNQ